MFHFNRRMKMRDISLQSIRMHISLLLAVTCWAGCSEQSREIVGPEGSLRKIEVPVQIGLASETAGDNEPRGTCNAGPTYPTDQSPHVGEARGIPPAADEAVPRGEAIPHPGETGFSWQLLSATATKSSAVLKPDQLYNLEIQQYDPSGTRIGGMPGAVTQAVGATLTLSLAASEDCQLVAVAWGEGISTRLGTGPLTNAQSLSLEASAIGSLRPDVQADMNRMPYVLHLKHVRVADGRIQSPEGHDVRLQLKRLAVRLSLDWDYQVSDYTLKQILLQSIPLNYKVIASPDAADGYSYPSLLEQFTTLQLSQSDLAAEHYACWVPANVRGTSRAATSPQFRTKQTAPVGSSFVDFVAVHTADSKKKLSYRVYLGGEESSDFNLYENTDYQYGAIFNHRQLPVNDRRVTIVDPIPASENNNNLVPTANCFLVAPGGSFCFDPFLFQQNGASIDNSTLKTWADAEGGIIAVKLLWQTKENGDVGDPVMGIVNSDDDHTNIVEIKHADGTDVTAVSPLTGTQTGRIYCRVAPGTTGGSGLIAAYSASGIIWSWHVWVTNYNPDPTGSVSRLSPASKRKLSIVNNSTGACQCVMMDRNLGAFEGFDAVPGTILEMSRANGFHYQKGRKDPFPSSYTSEKLPQVFKFVLSSDYPPKHFLNRYQPNGIDWIIPATLSYGSLRNAYKDPISISGASGSVSQWCSDSPRPAWGNPKTIHDPCPAGWRIPSKADMQILVNYNSSYSNWTGAIADGGMMLKYDETANRTYLRFTGYPPNQTQLNGVGELGLITVYDLRTAFEVNSTGFIHSGKAVRFASWEDADAHTTRCIQERID